MSGAQLIRPSALRIYALALDHHADFRSLHQCVLTDLLYADAYRPVWKVSSVGLHKFLTTLTIDIIYMADCKPRLRL